MHFYGLLVSATIDFNISRNRVVVKLYEIVRDALPDEGMIVTCLPILDCKSQFFISSIVDSLLRAHDKLYLPIIFLQIFRSCLPHLISENTKIGTILSQNYYTAENTWKIVNDDNIICSLWRMILKPNPDISEIMHHELQII